MSREERRREAFRVLTVPQPRPDLGKDNPTTIRLFSQVMELPYLLTTRPQVMVIGTGGGRDIFMASTHGASKIIGAEINSAVYQAMSAGGVAYDYSGHIYDRATVSAIDGRHLVKTVPPNSCDLIILNGVDTFSGLYAWSLMLIKKTPFSDGEMHTIVDYLHQHDSQLIFPAARDGRPSQYVKIFLSA